jgi:SWI/SNF-related matrix-associated actin-dependent regulator 1 of chromatin subfamily A
VRLITRGTIEEDMLKLGRTKLALDDAVAGETEGDSKGESAPEREMKTSLMNVLRKQFEQRNGEGTGAGAEEAATALGATD